MVAIVSGSKQTFSDLRKCDKKVNKREFCFCFIFSSVKNKIMNRSSHKNRRLCEKLNSKNDLKVSSNSCFTTDKEKRLPKCKPKVKKCSQNTFSMIKFYESIPSMDSFLFEILYSVEFKNFDCISNLGYDEIRHLPDYVFTEKMQLLKKIHCDLSEPITTKRCNRPSSSVSRCKRKTSTKKVKKDSANRKCFVSPSLCNVC